MRGQIRKRKESWAVVLYLGIDPRTKKKVYKWFSHKTRHEAEAHLTQLLAQVQAGGGIPPTRLRLGEFLEQWLHDYAESHVSPTTLRTYQDIVRVHVIPALGHVPLSRLSPHSIQRYLSEKLREGRLSPTTLQHHYRILHEALGHAVRWGSLVRNPCELVDNPKRRHVEMRVLDEEQVRLFLAEAKRSSQYYCLYLTAILTGMRQGELLGLRWKDVDFTLETVSIQQTFYRLGKQALFKEPKTQKSRRTVSLSPVLVEELRRLRNAQGDQRKRFGSAYQDNGLVFCQPNGMPLHGNNINRRDLKQILKRAGVPRIRFHDLRHSHASHLLKQGTNPKVVQERLGHSSPAFTLSVYSHVLPGMQNEAARRLEETLLGRKLDTENSRE